MTRVYVGNLPLDVREKELDDLFYKFGRIRGIDLKTPSRPPAFAFVEFEDPRDAQDAIRSRDGYDFHGNRLRVEVSHGARGGGGGGGGRDSYRDDRRDGGRSMGPAPYGPSRRTDFRVIVSGLPESASWQDLKDHMRAGGEVTFAQVMKEGRDTIGLVDYISESDMVRAIRKLDDSEFRNRYDTSYVRVKEDKDSLAKGRGRSRSRSRSRDRGARAVSRSRSRSASRGRSPSPIKRRSPSRSRSRSRSPASKSPVPRRSVSRSPSRSPARSD